MLNVLYWIVGIGIAFCIIALAVVVRFVLYGLGFIILAVIIGGVIATGLRELAQKKKPPE